MLDVEVVDTTTVNVYWDFAPARIRSGGRPEFLRRATGRRHYVAFHGMTADVSTARGRGEVYARIGDGLNHWPIVVVDVTLPQDYMHNATAWKCVEVFLDELADLDHVYAK